MINSKTPPCDPQLLWNSICSFEGWLDRIEGASYDPYDIWGTRYGLWSRQFYYTNNRLGVPLIAPLLLLEIFCPRLRSLFAKKQRFATADGQLILAYLNLHQLTAKGIYLEKAADVGEKLMSYCVPGFSGHCWGYPFDWQCVHGLLKKNTPFITTTPYCFEAFLALHDATGAPQYAEIAASVARFVFADLIDTPTSSDAAAGSYSPLGGDKVINASAYRAFVLIEAAHRFNLPDYLEKGVRNLNFILQNQQEDGAWLYALDSPGETFIDHFHTCFVLKNLCKLNRRLNDSKVKQAIRRGYDYYRINLFDRAGEPKSFAIQPRRQIVRLELYNYAEAITLGVLLRKDIPEAYFLSQKLGLRLVKHFQLRDGYFITRLYQGGIRHTLPFLRWPQSQLFYALTNLVSALTDVSSCSLKVERKSPLQQDSRYLP